MLQIDGAEQKDCCMSSPQHLSRKLTANYALIQSISNMGYCCVVYFAAVFLLSRGFSNAEVGVTLAIGSAVTLLAQPFIASFADRTQRLSLSQIIAGFLLLCLLLGLLLLLTPTLLVITAILYILLTCAYSCQVPLITSMAMEHVNAGTPLNFSLARGVGSFAFAALALLVGILSDQYGGWIVVAIGMAVSLVGMVLVLRFPSAQRGEQTQVRPEAEAVSFGLFMRQNKLFMALVGSVALLYFSHIQHLRDPDHQPRGWHKQRFRDRIGDQRLSRAASHGALPPDYEAHQAGRHDLCLVELLLGAEDLGHNVSSQRCLDLCRAVFAVFRFRDVYSCLGLLCERGDLRRQ